MSRRAYDVLLLGLTALAFGVSLVFDAFDEGDATAGYEDSFKLIGIGTLVWYCWHEALGQVTSRPPPATDS